MNYFIFDLRKAESELFKSIIFPDGQTLVELKDYFIDCLKNPENKDHQIIVMSHGKWEDWQKILSTINSFDYIKEISNKNIILYCPYLIGARSDRRFNLSCNYLKDVTLGIIPDNVTLITLDVHNEKALSVGCNEAYDPKIPYKNIIPSRISNSGLLMIPIFPDAGSAERYPAQGNCIIFDKERSSNGDIVGLKVKEEKNTFNCKAGVVIDDLCDGGRTFIEVGKKLKQMGFEYLELNVTHGIFSKGLDELYEYYDVIYTTNSYQELEQTDRLKVLDVFDFNNFKEHIPC